MPYVKRDDQGNISAIYAEQASGAAERLALEHPEVRAFLSASEIDLSPVRLLENTDTEVARILEDLVDLLIANQVIRFTDLPAGAQAKLLSRRTARERLQGAAGSVLDQSELL
jgi:hypothetical protein